MVKSQHLFIPQIRKPRWGWVGVVSPILNSLVLDKTIFMQFPLKSSCLCQNSLKGPLPFQLVSHGCVRDTGRQVTEKMKIVGVVPQKCHLGLRRKTPSKPEESGRRLCVSGPRSEADGWTSVVRGWPQILRSPGRWNFLRKVVPQNNRKTGLGKGSWRLWNSDLRVKWGPKGQWSEEVSWTASWWPGPGQTSWSPCLCSSCWLSHKQHLRH